MTTDPSTDGAPPGYDPGFLGVEVPLPTPAVAEAAGTVELTYTHFTVVLRPDRRLAAATAVNVDGASLREVERGDDWHLDPRVAPQDQVGPELYADNDVDRGHLVRRRDPVWGADAVAQQANLDTFTYTNAAPQAAAFNQDEELWLGLEDYLLENTRINRRRLSVLTGPVLAEDDPTYRGVAIPLRFWKVAAFLDGGELASTAYVLDQSPLIDDATSAGAAATDPAVEQAPPLGPYRTFQVPVADVVALTGLDLGPLPAVDRYDAGTGGGDAQAGTGSTWRRLRSHADVVWEA